VLHLRSGMHGTPVPKRDVELKARGSGPVITYKLSPEELERYRQTGQLSKEKRPIILLSKSKREKEDTELAELTREQYLRLRLEGKSRSEIQKRYFPTNTTKFYRNLKEWGVREKEDEDKVLEQLRGEQQPAPDSREEADQCTFTQELQQDLQKDAIVERLDQLLAEKTARIKELEEAVTQLQAERDVLLQTVEKAVDDAAPPTTATIYDGNSSVAEVLHDPVNRPAHYTSGKVECIDAIEAATVGLTGGAAYCTGNAIKYLWRWSRKGGVEDLRKARWYIDRLIEMIGNKERTA